MRRTIWTRGPGTILNLPDIIAIEDCSPELARFASMPVPDDPRPANLPVILYESRSWDPMNFFTFEEYRTDNDGIQMEDALRTWLTAPYVDARARQDRPRIMGIYNEMNSQG